MIDDLLNAIKMQALVREQDSPSRIAVVSSYDPSRYAVKCVLQPENVETGWLPVMSVWVGAGWGLFSPPSPGDWVKISFIDGDLNAGAVVGRIWTAQSPALACPSGEFWLVHQSGSVLKFLNSGDVQLVTNRDLNVTVGRNLVGSVSGDLDVSVQGNVNTSAQTWRHSGPVNINGNLNVSGSALVTQSITGTGGLAVSGGSGASIAGNISISGGNVIADGIDLKGHVHSGVQTGSGMTGGAQG